MSYSLNQASKATGKSKSTIANAIKKRRLSAIKGSNGEWLIDPSELHRVYPPLSEEPQGKASYIVHSDIESILRIKELETQLKMVEEERDRLAEQNGRLLSIVENQTTRLLTTAPKQKLLGWFTGRKTA